jgi:DNA-binding transcriptional regulator YbjK
MTDKERLEEINEKYMKHEYDYALKSTDIDWLIKQAERVEKLEEERDEWKDTAQSYYMTNQELREQNKRYRKAINNIIEKAMLFGTNEEVYDAIQDAIKALEVEKHD